jgi:hypothetical protein
MYDLWVKNARLNYKQIRKIRNVKGTKHANHPWARAHLTREPELGVDACINNACLASDV